MMMGWLKSYTVALINHSIKYTVAKINQSIHSIIHLINQKFIHLINWMCKLANKNNKKMNQLRWSVHFFSLLFKQMSFVCILDLDIFKFLLKSSNLLHSFIKISLNILFISFHLLLQSFLFNHIQLNQFLLFPLFLLL